MTCAENREQHSALLDGELSPLERARVEAHLADCPECSAELARLARMVGMLHALPAERAAPFFVDRVLAAVRPTPWYARLGRRLVQPWRVKLPLEAAALVIVALGAVYVFQKTPALQQAARYQAPAPAPTPAPPPPQAPSPATPPASIPATSPPVSQVPTTPSPAMPDERQRAKTTQPEAPARPAPSAPAPPASLPSGALSKDANRAESSKLEAPAKGPSPSEEAVKPQAAPAPAAKQAPKDKDSVSREEERAGEKKGDGARMDAQAPAAPPAQAEPRRQRLGRVAPAAPEAARDFVPPDASGRLAVGDREAAERALVELRGRLGVTEAFRRDAGEGNVVIEMIVPRAALADFTRGLDGIGRWTWDRDPSTLPPQIRLHILLAR
jgi:hypothetical protein